MKTSQQKTRGIALWAARISLALVFIINLQCCFGFIVFPEQFIGAYELVGVPGIVALQGLAVAFLMWNATYPIAIFNPIKYKIVFIIVLIQQAIGLIGESFIFLNIDNAHALLQASVLRFIIFDGAGLILMLISFICLAKHSSTTPSENTKGARKLL